VVAAEDTRPASLDARLFAFITDGIPLVVLGLGPAIFGLIDALPFFNFVAFQVYFVAFWSLDHGQTPGMRMVGIRVASRDGTRMRMGQAIIRALVLYFTFPIAVLTALLRVDRRGLHDLAARTQVVVK
jgi:uncharacterized RDD family membrane protein YckC